MTSISASRIIGTIATFYPRGVPWDDPRFSASLEWRIQQLVRNDAAFHQANGRKLLAVLKRTYGRWRVEDLSLPDMFPCYHYQIASHHDRDGRAHDWNWDIRLTSRFGQLWVINLFVSFLGPYFEYGISEYKRVDNQLYHRFTRSSPSLRSRLAAMTDRLGDEGWYRVPRALAGRKIPGFSTETCSAGRATVFDLLFSETFTSPRAWDGAWVDISVHQGEPPPKRQQRH